MKKRFLLIFLCCFCCCVSFAQQKLIEPYIDAWKVNDTSQTHRAEETYAWLHVEKDNPERNFPQHQELMRNLYAYLAQHPNDRLHIRTIMYEILGKFEYRQKILRQDSIGIINCVKLAHKLKDEQLKAEVYTLCAALGKNPNSYVLYNLKAVELEQKIGFSHFKFVHNRFFDLSSGLFHTNDYRKSVDYGLKCLSLKNVAKSTWDPAVYIFQLDMIGASYLKLQQYDSCKYYYQQIIDTLSIKTYRDKTFDDLWMGIAKGNIGHTLILQGNESQGVPLVKAHLQSSIQWKSYNNMVIAQNVLASLDFKHKRYRQAVSKWKQAYKWALQGEYYVIEQKLLSLKGLMDSFRALQQPDSAYKYADLYNKLNNERLLDVATNKLSAIRSKLEFDDLEVNLENTNSKLQQEKITRNFILGGIFLLTVISLLLYNRQRLKAQHQAEIFNRDRLAKVLEIEEAKEKINAFTLNVGEKEKLIKKLKQTIKTNYGTDEVKRTTISENLLDYVLLTECEWMKFKESFNKVHPLFFIRLKELMPNINPAEERLASLICLQLNNPEIANMLGISKDSVARSKRRLKHRIVLTNEQTLEDYICNLSGFKTP